MISWRSVLLVEEIGETHRPVASHWQTLSHNVVSSTNRHEWGSNSQLALIGTDYTGSCNSNYHMITTIPIKQLRHQKGKSLKITSQSCLPFVFTRKIRIVIFPLCTTAHQTLHRCPYKQRYRGSCQVLYQATFLVFLFIHTAVKTGL